MLTNLSALWRKLTTCPSSIATTSPAPVPAAMRWMSWVLYLPRSPSAVSPTVMFGCAFMYALYRSVYPNLPNVLTRRVILSAEDDDEPLLPPQAAVRAAV